MPGSDNEKDATRSSPAQRIEVATDDPRPDRGDGPASPGMRDHKGWDGKLRIDRNALLQNPEALSDPEYSDDENVLEGQEISADEGRKTC